MLYNPGNATHVRLLDEWLDVAGNRGISIVPRQVARTEDLEGENALTKKQSARIGIGLLGPDSYAIRKEFPASATR